MMPPAQPSAEHGQSLVELALVLPVFLLLILGMIDLGRAAIIMTTLDGAAREGARYATLAPADSAGITAAARRTAIVTGPTPVLVTTTYPNGAATSGNPVRVTVRYQLTFIASGIVGGLAPAGLAVTKSSQMVIE